ncbi:MAG: SPOR domain-containing protein, partial [Flavobacteriaceae bacterium]
MKTVVHILIVALTTTFASAQQGKVTIQQDERIADLLDIYESSNSGSNNYIIQVGFGTLSKAEEIKAEVEIDFP